MKRPANSSLPRSAASGRTARKTGGFTLAEVLAALMLMAIVVPGAMEGVSVAGRAGTLGHRKAAAARVAQRVLNEALVTGQLFNSSTGGSTSEGDARYEWKLETAPWSVDAMEEVTVRVTFTVQGSSYDIAVSTLHDPALATSTSF